MDRQADASPSTRLRRSPHPAPLRQRRPRGLAKSGRLLHPRLARRPSNPSRTTGWKLTERPTSFVLTTAKLHVIVDRKTGVVSFADLAGRPILSEAAGSRTLEPATVQGEETFHIQQKWNSQPGESLYGLGQMQLGITDIKGYDLDSGSTTPTSSFPFWSPRALRHSLGQHLLHPFRRSPPFVAIPPDNLYDADGKPGGLTLAPIDGSQPPSQSAVIGIDMRRNRPPGGGRPAPLKAQRWQGFLLAPSPATTSFRPTPTEESRSGLTASW